MSVDQTTANIQAGPEDADGGIVAQGRRHQGDHRRARGGPRGPAPRPAPPRATAVTSTAPTAPTPRVIAGRRVAVQAEDEAEQGGGRERQDEAPAGTTALMPIHSAAKTIAGGEPDHREGPAAEDQGGQHDGAEQDRPRPARVWNSRPARRPRCDGGRRLAGCHGQPALPLRPPKRRSRRWYSSMAARKAAWSKSGQNSGTITYSA